MLTDSFAINNDGHLTINGADTVELAKKYGTPLYVMDEDKIRSICRMYKNSIKQNYNGYGLPMYASKAFCCKEICRIMNDEGLGLDVVSEGELYTALSTGFPKENILMHGNNKTQHEIKYAVESEIGHIIVDNLTELHNIEHEAKIQHKTVSIMLRVKPGIDAHTHKFIKTGQIDSKFGFALETGEALAAAKEAVECENINLTGVHCHIGSQIFDINPFVLASEIMIKFMNQIKEATGVILKELNLGGGFGIKYIDSDTPIPYDGYMKLVSEQIHNTCTLLDFPLPKIYIEPGRSIVGEAGITLYTVGNIKEIPNIRTYVSVDGGMTDNPRYALYQCDYSAAIANRAGEKADKKVTIAGKACESGDLIQENTNIQNCQPGDILAVFSTGAYNYSMSSNYNRIPTPAVVMVKDGEPRVIVKRETVENLIQYDI